MDASIFGGPALPVAQDGGSGTPVEVKESTRALLRDDRTKGNERYLAATFSSDGNLVFNGQDLSVDEIFGYGEYEWAWTIAKTDLPALAQALGVKSDVLAAIENRFRGDDAVKLGPFFDEHKIAYEHWSRVGD